MKNHNFIAIARDFGYSPIQDYDPTYDQYPFYAFKMALSTVWQYFIFEELISTIAS
jgi:type III restriction enzyme